MDLSIVKDAAYSVRQTDARHQGAASVGRMDGSARAPGAVLEGRVDRTFDDSPSIENEHLVYRKIEYSPGRARRRAMQADLFQILRDRLEEIAASNDGEEVIFLALRHEKGLAAEVIAPYFTESSYAREDIHLWGSFKRVRFNDLFECFEEAAKHEKSAVFIEQMPYSGLAGDIQRLVNDQLDDDRVEEFRNRLRNRGFRLVLLLIIDTPITTSSILSANPLIKYYLPWSDLWLAQFAERQKLSSEILSNEVGGLLQEAAEWASFKDDDRERSLFLGLYKVATEKGVSSVGSAINAIKAAIDEAQKPADKSNTEETFIRNSRELLVEMLGPKETLTQNDPIKRVMLAVAAFAGGARVEEYYAICRQLLPEGEAEIGRLPRAEQDKYKNESIEASRLRKERVRVPDWKIVFDHECDAARATLRINVLESQAIQLDSSWMMIDLQQTIAHEYPGLITSLMTRIRDRRLFLVLPDAEAALLINILCAVRDACGDGFDDWNLAHALIGANVDDEIATPRAVVEWLYPGSDPDAVLAIANQRDLYERIAQHQEVTGEKVDPNLTAQLNTLRILFPEADPSNIKGNIEVLRHNLREGSVQRLERLIVRMRASSGVDSERQHPIVPSMLDILDRLLPSRTYLELLTFMISRDAEVDVADVGSRILKRFDIVHRAEIAEILLAVYERLRASLNARDAPVLNWLRAFDPVREGKERGDRRRAIAVFIWDNAISYDVPWSLAPYGRVRNSPIARSLFAGFLDSRSAEGRFDGRARGSETEAAMLARLVDGFLVQSPESFLRSLQVLIKEFDGERFTLLHNIESRIEDIIWVVMAGAAEADREKLKDRTHAMARDVLIVLTSGLRLGVEGDLIVAARKVEMAVTSPSDRLNKRWVSLYELFWPAMLAHWRFTVFGLARIEPGSDADRAFRSLLDQLVAAAPQRMRAFRDGSEILAKACLKCAQKATSLRAIQSADLYTRKADRLYRLAEFFAKHIQDLPANIS